MGMSLRSGTKEEKGTAESQRRQSERNMQKYKRSKMSPS